MKAFSRVPPFQQQNQLTVECEFPIDSVFTIDAINQTNKKRKTHIINNPNLITNIKKEAIGLQKQVENNVENQEHIEAINIKNEKILIQENGSKINQSQQQKMQVKNDQEIKNQHNLKLNLDDKSPINMFQKNFEGQGKLPIVSSSKQNQLQQNMSEEKFRQLSHIIFSPPQQNITTLLHKRPIFTKNNQNNLIPQSNLVQSIVRANQEQIQQNIVQNFNRLADQNEQNVESHIECTLFGNSKSKPESFDLYQTRSEFYNFNKQDQKITQKVTKQKQKSIYQKAQRQTSDKDLYDSYFRNRNKIKQLGGKKLTIPAKQSKLNFKPIKLQITKLFNISPTIF